MWRPSFSGIALWLEHQKSKQALVLEGQAQRLYLDRPFDQPDKAKANVDEAIEVYRKILDEHPRTVSAQVSLYLLANALMEQNKIKDAIESYENFVEEYDGHGIFLGLVLQRLGNAHLVNGDREKAFLAYSQILNVPDAVNKDQVVFEFAKLEEAEGEMEKAVGYYKQVVEQYPKFSFCP